MTKISGPLIATFRMCFWGLDFNISISANALLILHPCLSILHGCIDSVKMVVARPVRFLIAVSAGLVLFLFYKVLNPRPVLHAPVDGWNGEKIDAMERDPLLDRMFFSTHVDRRP